MKSIGYPDHRAITGLALILVLTLAGCRPDHDEDGLTIGVSIAPQAFLVERIGAPHVQIETMLVAGESPATFQPSDREISRILRSKIYFRLRLPFEKGKWFETLRRAKTELAIVDLTAGIALREMSHDHACSAHSDCEEHDEQQGLETRDHGDQRSVTPSNTADPHIWLCPAHLQTMARTITEALAAAAPEHAGEFQENLETLLIELDELHGEIETILAPHRGKSFFIYHPAWGYFCETYGLHQIPIELEGKEPSEAEISTLVARARRDGSRVVFVQQQIAGRSARAIADAIGAEIQVLDPLAADVLANLRHAAHIIADSYR